MVIMPPSEFHILFRPHLPHTHTRFPHIFPLPPSHPRGEEMRRQTKPSAATTISFLNLPCSASFLSAASLLTASINQERERGERARERGGEREREGIYEILFTYMCIYIYIYTHTYIHAYMHTCIQLYIYTERVFLSV